MISLVSCGGYSVVQNLPKRTVKDSVFTNLFKDKKYLLQLYNTLHPADYSITADDIKDVTLKHTLVDADYNDLGFSVDDRLVVLVESQSTWSLNIIIRALLYLVQTYHEFFKRTEQNLYSSKPVNMPKPELYVIFTGERPRNPPDIISLSKDFFHGERIAIDAEVRVIYHEDEDNIIGQYIIFCKVYSEQLKKHGRTKEAILETIRICKDKNVLKEYLKEKEQEVVDIMMTLFSDEYVLGAYAKEIKDTAVIETKRETEKATERKTAERLIKKGQMTLENIADCVPSLTLDELKEIKAEIMRLQ